MKIIKLRPFNDQLKLSGVLVVRCVDRTDHE